MNTHEWHLVVFKDGEVRMAPTIGAFASSRCSTLQCHSCPGRRCDVRSAMPIGQVLDEEGCAAIGEFLTSDDMDSPPSIRRLLLGKVLEAGIPALSDDERIVFQELLNSGMTSGSCVRSAALNALRSAAEVANEQNAL